VRGHRHMDWLLGGVCSSCRLQRKKGKKNPNSHDFPDSMY
jgi:hypothetical protein